MGLLTYTNFSLYRSQSKIQIIILDWYYTPKIKSANTSNKKGTSK